MHRLRNKTDSQCIANPAVRIEARSAVRSEGLVQSFACESRRLGDLAHSASARNVTKRSGKYSMRHPPNWPARSQVNCEDFLAVPEGLASVC